MSKSIPNLTDPPGLSLEQEVAGDVVTGAAKPPVPPAGARVRGQMRIVWGVLLLYAASFFCFYPKALTNFDEVSYVRQAAALAAGSATVEAIDPFTGQHERAHPSDYPAGTSALMVPFVWLAGWRGAFLLGLLALAACTIFTARWIADSGGSPLFALAVLGYLPAMTMARTGMSDVPSACLVAAGMWLFWENGHRAPWRRLAAGFVAGASICLREPTPILFAIFFAGALLRRERHVAALIVGGLAGVACRPLSAWLVYGDPWFVKIQYYGFTGMFFWENLVLYLTAMLVLVPGGLVFALFYKGKRRVELVLTVIVFVGMFIAYNYNGGTSGGVRQWMLSLRFLIPVVPIVAFAMSKTCARWYREIFRSLRPERRFTFERLSRRAVTVWVAGIVLMGFLVNWRSQLWSKLHEDVVQSLYSHTDPAQPILTDLPATVKFVNELYGERKVLDISGDSPGDQIRWIEQIDRLLDRNRAVQIVVFNREDSAYWRYKSMEQEAFIQGLSAQLSSSLKFQQRFPGLGVLQIWSVSGHS